MGIVQRGRTTIPAEIRKRHNIKAGNHLVWLDDEQTIRVLPIPADSVAALYGRGEGQRLSQKLLEERAREWEKENRNNK